MARSSEKSDLWRSFDSPKLFEALFTQDFFLFSVVDVEDVRGAGLERLTLLDRDFDGSGGMVPGLGGDNENGV